jgi:DNA adenine methylase
MFARDEFEALATRLRSLQGTFILSLNDHPDVRALFEGCSIVSVPVTYEVGGGGRARAAREVITEPGRRRPKQRF